MFINNCYSTNKDYRYTACQVLNEYVAKGRSKALQATKQATEKHAKNIARALINCINDTNNEHIIKEAKNTLQTYIKYFKNHFIEYFEKILTLDLDLSE